MYFMMMTRAVGGAANQTMPLRDIDWICIFVEVFGLTASGCRYAADAKLLTTAGFVAALIYIVADLTNKVVFGIVAVRAAKNS